jgi:hypothetical protein
VFDRLFQPSEPIRIILKRRLGRREGNHVVHREVSTRAAANRSEAYRG